MIDVPSAPTLVIERRDLTMRHYEIRKRILVTDGAGFLGYHPCDNLLDQILFTDSQAKVLT
jgi:hypothetical protein